MHDIAWSTEKDLPHSHNVGRYFGCHRYLIARASWNSRLLREKLSWVEGTADNQLDVSIFDDHFRFYFLFTCVVTGHLVAHVSAPVFFVRFHNGTQIAVVLLLLLKLKARREQLEILLHIYCLQIFLSIMCSTSMPSMKSTGRTFQLSNVVCPFIVIWHRLTNVIQLSFLYYFLLPNNFFLLLHVYSFVKVV